ncbi:MAG: cupredoxin domain-containing protein [Alphaproteobacteria bacterium]
MHAVLLAAFASLVVAATPARAEDLPTFKVEMKDGVITPLRLEVPADKPFKIELHNTGATPVEFESLELRKEKVVAPGAVSFVVIKRVSPGEYKFFDDFHPKAPQVIVVAK